MTERNFELVGEKCIRCNYICEDKDNIAKRTIRLRDLGVEIYYGRQWTDATFTTYCWFGEVVPTNSASESKRSDLKQPDGWTPRICLNYENCPIRDAISKDMLFEGKNDSLLIT